MTILHRSKLAAALGLAWICHPAAASTLTFEGPFGFYESVVEEGKLISKTPAGGVFREIYTPSAGYANNGTGALLNETPGTIFIRSEVEGEMLIGGFGAIGCAMRRQRRPAIAA